MTLFCNMHGEIPTSQHLCQALAQSADTLKSPAHLSHVLTCVEGIGVSAQISLKGCRVQTLDLTIQSVPNRSAQCGRC